MMDQLAKLAATKLELASLPLAARQPRSFGANEFTERVESEAERREWRPNQLVYFQ